MGARGIRIGILLPLISQCEAWDGANRICFGAVHGDVGGCSRVEETGDEMACQKLLENTVYLIQNCLLNSTGQNLKRK
jgi:hypothetical protein